MPRFSERVGAVKVETQVASMDQRLKHSLWNLVGRILPSDDLAHAVEQISVGVLKIPTDLIPRGYSAPRAWLFKECMKLTWAQVYDLVEFVSENSLELSSHRVNSNAFQNAANQILTEDHSAYRFIGGQLTPITNPIEIAEVESALAIGGAKFEGIRTHISQAVAHFGKRPAPDYRNAVKEAISAVESAAKTISGKDNATLDDALKAVAKAYQVRRWAQGVYHGAP